MLMWLSILPALILFAMVWKYDTIDKEPIGLVLKMFCFGCLSIIPAMVIELAGSNFMDNYVLWDSRVEYALVENFVLVACAEEGSKLLFLLTVRNNPNFDYTFDGIIYAVAVGLGFATVENIMYVMGSGSVGVAISRGLLSVPLHCTCAIFMGYFFGLAHKARFSRQGGTMLSCGLMAFAVPVIIHGFYDFSLSVDSDLATGLGLIFTVLIFIAAAALIKRSSKNDSSVVPEIPNPPRY